MRSRHPQPTCSRCRQRVWYAENDKTGATMILDDATYADGNVISIPPRISGRDAAIVHVLTKAELDVTRPMLPGLEPPAIQLYGRNLSELLEDVPRYKVHQATCQASTTKAPA